MLVDVAIWSAHANVLVGGGLQFNVIYCGGVFSPQQEDCEKAYFKMDNVLIDDRRIHVDFSQSVAKIKWKGKGNEAEGFVVCMLVYVI